MLVQNIASTQSLLLHYKFCAIKPDAIIQVASYKYVISLSNFNQIDCPTVTVIDLKEKTDFRSKHFTVAAFKVTLLSHYEMGGGYVFERRFFKATFIVKKQFTI